MTRQRECVILQATHDGSKSREPVYTFWDHLSTIFFQCQMWVQFFFNVKCVPFLSIQISSKIILKVWQVDNNHSIVSIFNANYISTFSSNAESSKVTLPCISTIGTDRHLGCKLHPFWNFHNEATYVQCKYSYSDWKSRWTLIKWVNHVQYDRIVFSILIKMLK